MVELPCLFYCSTAWEIFRIMSFQDVLCCSWWYYNIPWGGVRQGLILHPSFLCFPPIQFGVVFEFWLGYITHHLLSNSTVVSYFSSYTALPLWLTYTENNSRCIFRTPKLNNLSISQYLSNDTSYKSWELDQSVFIMYSLYYNLTVWSSSSLTSIFMEPFSSCWLNDEMRLTV